MTNGITAAADALRAAVREVAADQLRLRLTGAAVAARLDALPEGAWAMWADPTA